MVEGVKRDPLERTFDFLNFDALALSTDSAVTAWSQCEMEAENAGERACSWDIVPAEPAEITGVDIK